MNDVSPTTFTDVVRALFWLIGACGAAVVLINGVREWFRKPEKPSHLPQPMIVEFAKEFVPLKRHEALEREVRSGLKEVDERLLKVDADRRDSVNRCYKNTERLVGEMRAEIKQDQQDLSEQMRANNDGLNARVNDILAALSRLTGQFEQSQRK